ncbi:tubulin polyglutamylase TTLL13 [Musca domestica]|uniref:Tubulin polyglutamylase TTLL13 n=2 Tax=Musca domestica TaxID=7370 RepID=A0A9J7DAQ8_MUSDO|nr:tubulin polyglutamylase TTLL13 [Musca domestica]
MNLKKAKIFKRIQMLHRISREKLRQEKQRGDAEQQLYWNVERALCECNGNGVVEKSNDIENQSQEMDSSGMETMPSISSTRASICIAQSRYSMIGSLAKSLGYKLTKANRLWNILWSDSLPGVEMYKTMKRFQQINHFPGMMEICRKDLLSRNLNRMLKLYPKDYKIFPKTWIFPADYGEALNYAQSSCGLKTFILKPDSGAQGRGIWLTNDLKTINGSERMICQTYIAKPLLIDGYKFDLRVYALITSIDPLRIFVYNEGLARFATSKYLPPSMANNSDLYMHLTNYSVNRRNAQYERCDDDNCGSKRTFSSINTWLEHRNHNVATFWSRIDDIIIKTILSAWPTLKHNYHACFPNHDRIQACFEILGFDILVDAKFRPYILEVNHSPSFHTNEMVDRQVKRPLIRDTLALVSTALADKRQILKEDRKRVKQRLLKLKQENGSKLTDQESAPLSAMAQQIAWEESHLGNFRRIMPPNNQTQLNYYSQFYSQKNQASIYAETAASKKREEVSKRLRLQLEARRRRQHDELRNRKAGIFRFEERGRKRLTMPRRLVERQRLTSLQNQAHWTPGFISSGEERLRLAYMQMRSDLLKDNRILEMIYGNLFKAGILSNSDILKFPELYRNLENGCN